MRAHIFISSLVFFIFDPLFAKPTALSNHLSLLDQTTAKYRNAKLVEMDLEKSVRSDLTGKNSVYKGTLYLSTGKFRMVQKEPDPSLVVFDGRTVWNEQPASQDFPGPVQVTKARLSSKNKAQTVFATLLTTDPIAKNFKIISSQKDGDQTVFLAAPLKDDPSLKKLVLKINSKSKEVSEISYQDDIGNETSLKLANAKFNKSSNPKLFQYKPPKGAQVNEL